MSTPSTEVRVVMLAQAEKVEELLLRRDMNLATMFANFFGRVIS